MDVVGAWAERALDARDLPVEQFIATLGASPYFSPTGRHMLVKRTFGGREDMRKFSALDVFHYDSCHTGDWRVTKKLVSMPVCLSPGASDRWLERLASVQLTLVCLGLAMALVILGNLAQVHMDTFAVQKEFFNSGWIYGRLGGMKVPCFPAA